VRFGNLVRAKYVVLPLTTADRGIDRRVSGCRPPARAAYEQIWLEVSWRSHSARWSGTAT
jgi:hypothetical protein